MKLTKKAGSTSEIWQIWLADTSSTTGAGLTGLVFNSANLTAYYHRDTDTTATVISLQTMTVGTFTTSGFKEIDATNMPGWYQFCPPNAAIAAGAKSCAFYLKGATNMAPLAIEVQLTAIDVDSATAFMTSVASVTGSVGSVTGAVGSVTGSVGSVTGAVGSVTGNVGGSVASVTARVTANTDQLAGQTVSAAAGVTFPSSVASPTNITAGVITTTTNLTNAPSNGDFTAAMKTSLNAATPASVVGAVGSVTGNVGGNVTGSVGSVVGLTVANLDVTISSRLATASYTAPDNADIILIKAKTDNLPASPADETLVIAATNAIMSRIGAPVGASISVDVAGVPAAILSAATTTPIAADVKKINSTPVNGNGSLATPWGP